MGLRKTIGPGLNTKAWSKPWVPDIRARPPRAAPQVGYPDPGALVYHFIHHDTKQWNVPLLNQFFQPEDVALILGLRPSRNRTLDGYAWNHSKSGLYTVKSGYDLIRGIKLDNTTSEMREPSITALLSQVWESQHARKNETLYVKARNNKIFNGKEISPEDTLLHARVEADCWRTANQPEDDGVEVGGSPGAPPTPISTSENRRIPICRIDASWIDHGPVSGLGWTLVDGGGTELVGQQGCRRSLSALHAEMDCLIWAMTVLRDRQISSIHIKTDCLDLVTMSETPEDWPLFVSELNSLDILRKSFLEFRLSHILRN
ncbi:uncharacterized protein LOC112082122 [Eutrema salsugineum]|uniref:uncharacterized protein LOC112082122 n=1 Tax=Eutrema salsugineum TaxID=72664 RepID=UPI000CED7C19|nr:uncharacterized protein LOC112082122 [Eutrema salsugineum]